MGGLAGEYKLSQPVVRFGRVHVSQRLRFETSQARHHETDNERRASEREDRATARARAISRNICQGECTWILLTLLTRLLCVICHYFGNFLVSICTRDLLIIHFALAFHVSMAEHRPGVQLDSKKGLPISSPER